MLDRFAESGASRFEVAEPVMNPPQIDEGIAKKNVGVHLAGMVEAFFEMRDCVGIPVVQQ